MNRNQHIYHFLHNDIYLPMSPSLSPYSKDIVRSLTLCSDIIEPYDEVDTLCAFNNNLTNLCKLVTTKGFWSPTDPATEICTWKIGCPKYFTDNETPKSAIPEREPFLVAVLPHPSTYLWRLWLSDSSSSAINASNRMPEFDSWVGDQPDGSMLDALIPPNIAEINTDNRITHIINTMRSGSALVVTEKFIIQLHNSTGNAEIEKWISAHLGFFLTLPQPKISSWTEPVKHNGPRSCSIDDRFYSAIERENERWTNDWNSWRKSVLSDAVGSFSNIK